MPAQIEAHERRVRALELRKKGMSYRQIAVEEGYAGPGKVQKAVESLLNQMAREPAAAVRQLELERLDALLAAYWNRALIMPSIAELVLKIMDRRAKYLGLDAPTRVDITEWIVMMAEKEGLDPHQAVKDAEFIVARVEV